MTRVVKNPGRGYAGKEKIEVYLYDPTGKFVSKFESLSAASKALDYKNLAPEFSKSKTRNEWGYMKLHNGSFLANFRIGRDKLRHAEAIVNCPYCKTKSSNKGVLVFNRKGEKIAYFNSLKLASELTGVNAKTIQSHCNDKTNKGHNGLTFKYDN